MLGSLMYVLQTPSISWAVRKKQVPLLTSRWKIEDVPILVYSPFQEQLETRSMY
jgi:hypothetical protein